MCVWEGGEGRDENVISNKKLLVLPLIHFFVKFSVKVLHGKYVTLGIYVCGHSHENLPQNSNKNLQA